MVQHAGFGAKVLMLGMNPSNINPGIPFQDNLQDESGQRLMKLLRKMWGDEWRMHTYVVNYSPLVFLDGRQHLGMRHISDIYGPHLLCGAEDGCDKHLMKLVDALSINVVVALGRYVEKRARAAVEGRNVRVAYLLHPSPRNDMPGSDWVDVAQASSQNVFPQIRVQGRHGPNGRIEQEQQAAPSTPVRRRHSMELPLQQQQVTPERLVRRSRSPRRSVRMEISDLRLGRGPSSLSTVLVVSGKVVRSHAFCQGGGSLRLRDPLTMHDIDMKFVGAASNQYCGDVVGCWVCVRSFKVLRIKDEVCKSYAPPGTSPDLVVTDSCADVKYLRCEGFKQHRRRCVCSKCNPYLA